MKSIRTERGLALLALVTAGVAGLMLATTASTATVTINVGSLLALSGSVTGTITGFQPNATVTINGISYLADATGVVTLSGAPLGGSSQLAIGFVDGNGGSQSLVTGLKDTNTGVTLSAADLSDVIPNVTAPVTLTIDSAGTTTTAGSGTTTTASGGGTTTTTSTGGSGSAGGSSGTTPAGAQKLSDGSVSIPASSVAMPYRLVIKQVVFTPRLVRAHRQPVTVRYRIADTRGNWVRNASVWMRTLPLGRLSSVKTKPTSMTGWVSFTVRSGMSVKLQNGGRINVFVRAWTPGEPIIGGTSTRRLVSLRVTRHH